MTRRTLLLSVLALAASAWPSVARPQGEDVAGARARFEGRWRLAVAEPRANQTIDQAVARAADAMPFFARGIARGRLREGTPLIRRIDVTFDAAGEQLAVAFDGRRYETPIGRTVFRTRPSDGERLRVTQRVRPSGQLEQVFQSDGGTRWYVYTATGEGTMRMDSTTDSDRMPQPMVFALDYRRE